MYIQENLEVTTFSDSDACRKKEIDFTIQKESAQQSKSTKETYVQIQKGGSFTLYDEDHVTKYQKKMRRQLSCTKQSQKITLCRNSLLTWTMQQKIQKLMQ